MASNPVPPTVAPGIRRLTNGVSNFYMLEEGRRLVLVDAGVPGDWERFTDALSALARRLEDLEAILLTHAHSDHVGFAERGRAESGAVVWIHGGTRTPPREARPGRASGDTSATSCAGSPGGPCRSCAAGAG